MIEPAFSSLNLRQRRFVKHYTSEPLLGNGRRSYMAAFPKAKAESADAAANRLLRSHKVRAAVCELLEANRLGVEPRIEALGRILNREQHIEQVYDRDGKIVRTIVRPTPTRDVIRAIDLLNKMDGLYRRAATSGDSGRDALRDLISKHTELLDGG